jgi:hypothetical protein
MAWVRAVRALVGVVAGSVALLACGVDAASVACRGSTRLADIAVDVRADIPIDAQYEFINSAFVPGEEPVAGESDYSVTVGFRVPSRPDPTSPIVNIFLRDRLDAERRVAVRREILRRYADVEGVRFEVLPVGGGGPTGEC